MDEIGVEMFDFIAGRFLANTSHHLFGKTAKKTTKKNKSRNYRVFSSGWYIPHDHNVHDFTVGHPDLVT